MTHPIFSRTPLRLLFALALISSSLISSGVWFAAHSDAQSRAKGRATQSKKLTAKQIHESRERQEERVRERARRLANKKPLPEQGKTVLPGPRLDAPRLDTMKEARPPRAPYGFEADDVTNFERGDLYDKPSEAARYFRRKRLPIDGAGKFTMEDLPLERYFTAESQMREMPLYSSALNQFLSGEKSKSAPLQKRLATEPEQNTWQPLGPGNIGGRTRALVINPQDPNVMYAAGVSGGVWKTTDAGQNWTPIGDRLAQLTVSSLLLDPTNASVLYVGTGEGVSAFDQDTQGDLRGLGIFKSTDAGATFTRLEATNNSNFYFVNDLVVSPSSNQRIYAATRTGVWRTTDGGTTWTRVHEPRNDEGDPATGGCLDLAIRTDKPAGNSMDADVVFASCGTFEQAQVFRTTNGAGSDSWQMV